MNEIAELLAKRKAAKRAEKRQLQGKVISSYYSANDVELITQVAEESGVALGGLQHEALMIFIDNHFKREEKEKRVDNTLVTASAKALDKLKQAYEEQHDAATSR